MFGSPLSLVPQNEAYPSVFASVQRMIGISKSEGVCTMPAPTRFPHC